MGNTRLVTLLTGDELVLFSDTLEGMKEPACVLRPSYDDKFTSKPVTWVSSPFYFMIQLKDIQLSRWKFPGFLAIENTPISSQKSSTEYISVAQWAGFSSCLLVNTCHWSWRFSFSVKVRVQLVALCALHPQRGRSLVSARLTGWYLLSS